MWLGIQAIRHRGDARHALLSGDAPPERTTAALRTGFVVGVTNPKTIVFFVAFLPQFTSPDGPAGPQLALLGVVFGLLALASDSASGPLVAGRARLLVRAQARSRLDTMSTAGGVMMIGLGATMAATD